MASKKSQPKKKKNRITLKTNIPKMSPLLRSALEVIEHGLWHFFRSDTATDMKFAILHIDQGVELILKERVRTGGKSIYKNPKETISMWGAYDILEKELSCSIAEKPNLELLHEERNNIQHKYANPSPEDANFHISNGLEFLERFLKDELKIDIYDYISSEFLDQILPFT